VSGETFIGGFMSGFLARGFLGLQVGYGLYFTTARVFGVDPGRHGGSELTGTMAGYIEGELTPKLSEDENARVIAELDRVKDFDLAKDQVKQIELKSPGSFGIGLGHVRIVSQQGGSRRIVLRNRIAYDRLVELTQAFSPELLKTKPFLSV
jgi:hypothetical protein